MFHRFSIALSLGEVDTCVELAAELKSDAKWLQCEELAQRKGDMETAKRCLIEAKDHAGLLLQASAQGKCKFSTDAHHSPTLVKGNCPLNLLVRLVTTMLYRNPS